MSTTSTPGPHSHESHGAVGAEATPCRRSGFSPGRPRRYGPIASSEGEKKASFLSSLLAASRKLYVYLHIDPELLKNGQFEPPGPNTGLENYPSFACHSRLATLADGTSGERVSEVFE